MGGSLPVTRVPRSGLLQVRAMGPHVVATYGIWLALAILMVVSTLGSRTFLTAANAKELMGAMAILGIVSVGQTVVILSGGIDLSVGMLMGLVTVLTNGIMNGNPDMASRVVVLGVAIGLVVGLINGILLIVTRIHPLILTFGMMSILQGTIFLYTNQTIGNAPSNFRQIAESTLGPIPVLFLIMAAVVVIAWFLTSSTVFGRYVYALGGSELYARRVGIPVPRVKVAVYGLSGLCAGIAGIGLAARLGSGYTLAGQGFELDSIVAVVLGGTSLAGGRGSVLRTAGGVLFLTVLSNALNLMGISAYTQQVIKGVVIVAAVVLYTQRRRF